MYMCPGEIKQENVNILMADVQNTFTHIPSEARSLDLKKKRERKTH